MPRPNQKAGRRKVTAHGPVVEILATTVPTLLVYEAEGVRECNAVSLCSLLSELCIGFSGGVRNYFVGVVDEFESEQSSGVGWDKGRV